MEVHCYTFFESEPNSISRDGLIRWLKELPKNVVLTPQEVVHAKLWIKAEWIEIRE
jgi:hypothetical protein